MILLRPYYNALRVAGSDENLQRIMSLKERIQKNADRKCELKKLRVKSIIDAAISNPVWCCGKPKSCCILSIQRICRTHITRNCSFPLWTALSCTAGIVSVSSWNAALHWRRHYVRIQDHKRKSCHWRYRSRDHSQHFQWVYIRAEHESGCGECRRSNYPLKGQYS